MPGRAPFSVTADAADLTAGLTAGQRYNVQHAGGAEVLWVNAATDPTNADIGWNILHQREWITFMVDAANPVWVRTRSGEAVLSINDG